MFKYLLALSLALSGCVVESYPHHYCEHEHYCEPGVIVVGVCVYCHTRHRGPCHYYRHSPPLRHHR